MASGQVFSFILSPVGSSLATLTSILGTSTPTERFPVIAFDDGPTIEYHDLIVGIFGYGGGGFTVRLPTASVVAGGTDGYVFEAAWRAIPDDAEDVDTTSHDYASVGFNSTGEITCASAVGEFKYSTITFSNGADSDSVGDNTMAVLRIRRNVDDANDTMTGDAYIHWPGIIIHET